MSSLSEIDRQVAGVAGHLGTQLHDDRVRRRWTIRQLADRAGVSPSLVHWVESGRPASLATYARLASALHLRCDFDIVDPRRKGTQRLDDPVHASMGEWMAATASATALAAAVDEPYQHYQFAGRADVLAWSVERGILLHAENRTRFPNLQDAFGSYNAKRRYLPGVIAERLGVRPFRTVVHALVCLWSSEVLHTIRVHQASFRAVCPDPIDDFRAILEGQQPRAGASSCLVILDPLASGRQRAFVSLDHVGVLRPRYRGYADALDALRRAGRA